MLVPSSSHCHGEEVKAWIDTFSPSLLHTVLPKGEEVSNQKILFWSKLRFSAPPCSEFNRIYSALQREKTAILGINSRKSGEVNPWSPFQP